MFNSKTQKIGYISLTGFSALLIGIGIGRFCYPSLIPAIIHHHWFSTTQADYLGAINLAGYVIGAAFAWKISYKIAATRLIKIAILLIIVTFAGCAFPLPFMLYSFLRLLEGFAGAIIMVLTPSTIYNHIPASKKGIASGIIFSGIGVGIVLVGVVTPFLISKGLAIPWYFYALLSAILFAIFYKGWPPSSIYKQSSDSPAKNKVKISRALLLLMIIYACNAIGFAPYSIFWVDYISRGLNMGIDTGNLMWLIFGIGGVAGPLLSGTIADKAGIARSLIICIFIDSISVILPVFSSSFVVLILSSFFVGSSGMVITSLVAAEVTELVDKVHQKQVWGWMTILFSILYAGDACLCSFLFSITGSYHLLFIISGTALFTGGIINLIFDIRKTAMHKNT